MKEKLIEDQLQKAVDELSNNTDGWPWYWLAYGDKCYAFAVVEAYPAREGDPFPRPGSRLSATDDTSIWLGENGTKMSTGQWVTESDSQNGDVICEFIALAYAKLAKFEARP